ncbi:MAG: HAD hydrolase-like protein [Rhodothermales bacterium]|nr:HAD hydrolase-like protein [Rhodothermales bacterium]
MDVFPSVTCVLFDMDGVLVDVSRSYRSAVAQTAEHFTGQVVEPHVIQEYKNRGGFNDDWELTHAIIRETGVEVRLDDVVREFQIRYRGSAWNGLIADETPLVPHSLLEGLAITGIDIGVVTGRPAEEALWTIEHLEWSRFFKVVIAREQQGERPKPDGYPLTRALEQLREFSRDHLPGESAYVGDTIDDMQAATNAGVIPVGFVPPYLETGAHSELLRSHGARFVVSSHEALALLVGLV